MRTETRSLQRHLILMLFALLLAIFAWTLTFHIQNTTKTAHINFDLQLSYLIDNWHNLLQSTYRLYVSEASAPEALAIGRRQLQDVHQSLEEVNKLTKDIIKPNTKTYQAMQEFSNSLKLSLGYIKEPWDNLETFIQNMEENREASIATTSLYDYFRGMDNRTLAPALSLPLAWIRQDLRELGYSFNDLLENKLQHIRIEAHEGLERQKKRNHSLQTLFLGLIVLAIIIFILRIVLIGRILITLIDRQTRELDKTLEHLTNVQDELVRSQTLASLGELSAGISHELNTPLGAIYSSIGILEHEVLPTALKFASEFLETPEEVDAHEFLIDLSQRAVDHTGKLSRKDIQDLAESWEAQGLNADTAFFDLFTSASLYPIGQKIANWEINHRRNRIIEEALIFARSIGIIAVASEKATSVIRALRNQVSGLSNANISHIFVSDSVDQALTLLQTRIKKSVEIIKHYVDAPKVFEKGGQLSQVWLNLLSNSLDAMDNAGSIEIRILQVTDMAIIQIIDSGKGIDQENLPQIFTPWFTTRKKGLGLGLHITKNIVESHGGSIEAIQIEGKTCMQVSLPLDHNPNT